MRLAVFKQRFESLLIVKTHFKPVMLVPANKITLALGLGVSCEKMVSANNYFASFAVFCYLIVALLAL